MVTVRAHRYDVAPLGALVVHLDRRGVWELPRNWCAVRSPLRHVDQSRNALYHGLLQAADTFVGGETGHLLCNTCHVTKPPNNTGEHTHRRYTIPP